jgi:N-acetylmuramoyl-L-alanine amidase
MTQRPLPIVAAVVLLASALAGVEPSLPAVGAGARAAPPRPPAKAAATEAPRTAVPAPTLTDLRMRSYPSFTRVVIETTSAVRSRVDGSGPKATRVRLLGVAADPQTEAVRDGFLDEVRVERSGPDTVVHVLFETPAGELKIKTLSDPPRLVLDFARPGEAGAPARREGATRLRSIVLDAGHGGHDSGTRGPTGLFEKDLVLDVTRRVARLARERLDLKVLLSRDDDRFVTLKDRTSFANRENADLFMSIHANGHRQADSQGIETYFLSSEATDSAARQLAAAENNVIQLERPVASVGRPDFLKSILWDLAQSEFQVQSSRVAEILLDSMTRALRVPNRGVKQAGFYVLGGAAMPAVLIEIGFVTNPREERRLKDSGYREEIARAIFAGLAEYKRDYEQGLRGPLAPGR